MADDAQKTLKKTLQVAHAEGISFLALLLIAMPLKHFMGMPLAVTIAGSIHGILFIAFLWYLYEMYDQGIWTVKKCAYALLLGIIPTGTFFLK